MINLEAHFNALKPLFGDFFFKSLWRKTTNVLPQSLWLQKWVDMFQVEEQTSATLEFIIVSAMRHLCASINCLMVLPAWHLDSNVTLSVLRGAL